MMIRAVITGALVALAGSLWAYAGYLLLMLVVAIWGGLMAGLLCVMAYGAMTAGLLHRGLKGSEVDPD